MREILLTELLKAGAHFGHQTAKWHPKMAPYIFAARNGVHIINLEKTAEKLESARQFAKAIAREGFTILFIGTKRQAKDIIKRAGEQTGMPYVSERWIGGTLTNYTHIARLIEKLSSLEAKRASPEFELHYTKKERLVLSREIKRLEVLVGGIRKLTRLPDAVCIVDIKKEKTALREARRTKVPLIALVDSNCNPEEVDFPIPGNDDATKSIELIVDIMVEAVVEGTSERERAQATESSKETSVPPTPVAPKEVSSPPREGGTPHVS